MYKLPTKQQLLDAGAPYGSMPNGYPKGMEATEWLRTEPDAVIFIPDTGVPADSANEHIHVAEVPGKDCLFAVWQQNTIEGSANTRVVYSRSRDGQIFEPPKMLAGVRPGKEKEDILACHPFMVAAPTGRIYTFYVRHLEPQTVPVYYATGFLACTYSDDCGDTWSEPVNIRYRENCREGLDKEEAQTLVVLQSPVILKDGRCLISYSNLPPKETYPYGYLDGMLVCGNRSFFAIIENFADNPSPEDFQITWLPDDDKGLVIKEQGMYLEYTDDPFVIELPNGWLYVCLRTLLGAIYYSVSKDGGHTWSDPKPQRFANGDVFVHPTATPFLCDCKDGRYMQLYNGRSGGYKEMFSFRDKVYRTFGRFAPEDEQPIRFEDKGELYLSADVAAGLRWEPEVNLEGAFTCFHGEPMFWYGDRKHYVLGKRV